MTKTKLILLGFASSLCMSACSTIPTEIGVANRAAFDEANNKQIVSSVALKGAPERDATMTAAAIQRYLEDDVKEPDEGGSFSPGG